MGGSLLDREPCPDRILDDAGVGFAMGVVGGSAYHFIKGLRNSPRGTRIPFGMEAVRMNVPRLAGRFAAWGGLFSTCNCALVFARQKEDPYNDILAGAATGGILHVRQGIRSVLLNSLGGAVFLALAGGVALMTNRLAAVPNAGPMPVNEPFIPHVEDGGANSSSKTETLDDPSTPIPSFAYK